MSDCLVKLKWPVRIALEHLCYDVSLSQVMRKLSLGVWDKEVRRAGKGQRIASSGVHTPAPTCGKQRLSSSLLGGRLQAIKNLQHRWGQIRVVMRNLPRSSFSLINVRYPNLAGDLLSA